MSISPAELILNADGSIYHLNLFPEDIAHTIITVGDPERVPQVSKYLDNITVKKGKREFITHTGTLSGKWLTIISTGIGTDNVDIVLNELDALVNLNWGTGMPNENRIRLKIIRIGTSGAIQPDIPVDSFLLSEFALGLDGLLHFYEHDLTTCDTVIRAFMEQLCWSSDKALPYLVECDQKLALAFNDNRIRFGVTATNPGFYGPQGRSLRVAASMPDLVGEMARFRHGNFQLANLEMETSGIYALSKLLDHKAVSLNCILANRSTGEFSKNPNESVEKLIRLTLEKLTAN